MFGLDEMMARYASYPDLTEIVRERFTEPKATLRELFARIVFNVLSAIPTTMPATIPPSGMARR